MTTMNVILLIIAFVTICYLIYAIYMQAEANSARNTQIDLAEDNYNLAKQTTDKAKQDLLKKISEVYGQEVALRIEQNKIWIGMDSDLILSSWGRAGEIKESYSKGIKIEKWYYQPYLNRLNNIKYKFEIIIENNIVVDWKDLV